MGATCGKRVEKEKVDRDWEEVDGDQKPRPIVAKKEDEEEWEWFFENRQSLFWRIFNPFGDRYDRHLRRVRRSLPQFEHLEEALTAIVEKDVRRMEDEAQKSGRSDFRKLLSDKMQEEDMAYIYRMFQLSLYARRNRRVMQEMTAVRSFIVNILDINHEFKIEILSDDVIKRALKQFGGVYEKSESEFHLVEGAYEGYAKKRVTSEDLQRFLKAREEAVVDKDDADSGFAV